MNSFISEIEKKVAALEAEIQDQPSVQISKEEKALLSELPARLLTCSNHF
jgi:hypothetical protein